MPCYRQILVSPHVGRGMSTVTTWSERCTSSGSMGNSSGTRYPPQSTWSSVMPHRETSHKSSAVKPIGPQLPRQRPKGKMPPLEGVNPGNFEADDSNIERWLCGSAPLIRATGAHLLPTPIPLWPQALLRTGLGVGQPRRLRSGHDLSAFTWHVIAYMLCGSDDRGLLCT
jgi:hypothetical protein